EILRLDGERTQGEWRWFKARSMQHLQDGGGSCFAEISMPIPRGRGNVDAGYVQRQHANADFIALAPSMARIIRGQQAQIEMLKRALVDCADELEAEISGRYGSSVHPAMALRYKRDMQFVEEARQLIDRIESGEWLE